MAVKGYTTKAKVAEFLNETISITLEDIILAVEKFIDEYTGRNFIADTEATVRYFNGDSSQNLIIDDCIDVTKVEVGNNSYGDSYSEINESGTDRYYTLPINNKAEFVPIRKIHLRARTWAEGIGNHKITAKWGFSETCPADISKAASILAAGIYKYGRSGSMGGIKSEKIGDYNISFAD
ncbi:MAG: hypothetical protein U9R14_03985, partial [Patescibacteria group bacterium]|nr:hypothetical protein [Patescibacteria group bacterium]